MKNISIKFSFIKNYIYLFFMVTLIGILINTNFFLNSWMIITDSANYIPNNSSIFTFEPIQIDKGSGGYWRYGKDNKYYYYFSEIEENTYYYASIDNECTGFDKKNYLTWCQMNRIHNRK